MQTTYLVPARIVLDNAQIIVQASTPAEAASKVQSGKIKDVVWDDGRLIGVEINGVPERATKG